MDIDEPDRKIRRIDSETLSPTLEITESCEVEEPPSTLIKTDSIKRDIEQVKGLLTSVDSDIICAELIKEKSNPERVAIATNLLLDNSFETTEGRGVSGKSSSVENKEGNDLMEELFADVKKVCSILEKSHKEVDKSEIYDLLVKNSSIPERVGFVSGILSSKVKNPTSTMASAVNSNAILRENIDTDPLFRDMREIAKMFPKIKRKLIFDRLEAHEDDPERVNKICNEFIIEQETGLTNSPEDNRSGRPSSTEISTTGGDQALQTDVLDILAVFPHWKNTEVYAHLEVHYYKSDRKQRVIDELIPIYGYSDPANGDNVAGPAVANPELSHESLFDQVQHLKQMFPDCEPNYLYDRLNSYGNDDQRLNRVVAELMDKNKKYPKISELVEYQIKKRLREKIRKLEFNLGEFLKTYPDPVKYFVDGTFSVSFNYKQHTKVLLKNYFPSVREDYIADILNEHKGHLTPALKQLSDIPLKFKRTNRKIYLPHHMVRNGNESMPKDPDEMFYKELMFTENRQVIEDHLEGIAKQREKRIQELQAINGLATCGCCFDDELLPEETYDCGNAEHQVCGECVRRSTETNLGDGKVDFPCLQDGCENQFSLNTLQANLLPNIFSKVLGKIQEKEINAAGVDGLVTCPFCPYATIIDNEDDKILHCRNPDCLKESCRNCGEAAHIPLRCDEVEKGSETNMRTYIEEKIAEAMIRTCYKCKKRFLKDFGCNKMTCVCGASMCYVCQKPIKGYDHFGKRPGQCPIHTDIYEMHRKEMEEAGLLAKEKYIKDNPHAAHIELQRDPLLDVEEYVRERNLPRRLPRPEELFHGLLLPEPDADEPPPEQRNRPRALLPPPLEQRNRPRVLLPPPPEQRNRPRALLPPPPERLFDNRLLAPPPPEQRNRPLGPHPPPPERWFDNQPLGPPPPDRWFDNRPLGPPPPEQRNRPLVPPPPDRWFENRPLVPPPPERWFAPLQLTPRPELMHVELPPSSEEERSTS